MMAPATTTGKVAQMRPTSTSDAEKASLRKQMAFLEAFRRVRSTMPLQHAYTFMLVAMNEGLGVQDYAELADVSQSVMTRNLLDLGDRNRRREPGYGLVTQRMDPLDMRRHQTILTPEGRALVRRIIHAVEG